MERMTRAANFKNLEKNPLLPPQTSLPSNETPVYEDCGPSGSKEEPWLRKALIHDHPSSPESISIEEHLSWLIDLLYEPDTPVKICAHRPRLYSNLHNFALEECRQRAITPSPLWGLHEFDPFKHDRHYSPNTNWSNMPNYTVCRPGLNMLMYSNSLHAAKGKFIHPSPSGAKLWEHEAFESNAGKNPEQEVSPEELKNGSENKDVSETKHTKVQTGSSVWRLKEI